MGILIVFEKELRVMNVYELFGRTFSLSSLPRLDTPSSPAVGMRMRDVALDLFLLILDRPFQLALRISARNGWLTLGKLFSISCYINIPRSIVCFGRVS